MFEYSQATFEAQYNTIKDILTNEKIPNIYPKAYILGGQPGAGKSNIIRWLKQKDKNIIAINADDFRVYHPFFDDVQTMYGKDSPKYTQSFINKITEKLIDELSNEKYSLIIEGTLRTAEVPLKTCLDLKQKGYSVELNIISVKKAISFESTLFRYEVALSEGDTPRATAKEHHDMVADAIADNLNTIEKAGVFEAIKLFNRNGDCLYPTVGNTNASEVESKILNGWWTIDEIEQLKEIIFAVTDLKTARNAEDLTAYKKHSEEVIAFAESNRYHYIKANSKQAEQLRIAGVTVEGNTTENKVSVIRIPPTQAIKAEQILSRYSNTRKK